jgi:hypothetical protein
MKGMNVCFISMHEKGFWQGDIYLDVEVDNPREIDDRFIPDHFYTGKVGGDREYIANLARRDFGENIVIEYC